MLGGCRGVPGAGEAAAVGGALCGAGHLPTGCGHALPPAPPVHPRPDPLAHHEEHGPTGACLVSSLLRGLQHRCHQLAAGFTPIGGHAEFGIYDVLLGMQQ